MTTEPWFHPDAIQGIFEPKPAPRGVLTKEGFLRARKAIERQRPQPTMILTSMATIESGQRGARNQERAAGYALGELALTSRWRWLKRRVLRRQIAERLRNADALRGVFGWPS